MSQWTYITSRQNNRVKNAIKLQQKKYRQDKKQFLLEGFTLIEAALKAGVELEEIFFRAELEKEDKRVSKILSLLPEEQTPLWLEDDLFAEVATTVNPQGVLAIAKARPANIEKLWQKSGPLLLLAGIQDPGNLGTLIRSAAAANIAGLLTLKGTVDIFNPKVIRGSMGGIFHLPIVYSLTTDEVESLKHNGDLPERPLLAATPDAPNLYTDELYQGREVLLIGNESRGIPADLEKLTDKKIKIPLSPSIESLNAAVAGSVIIFEMVRQTGL